jgi:hypothetical protein
MMNDLDGVLERLKGETVVAEMSLAEGMTKDLGTIGVGDEEMTGGMNEESERTDPGLAIREK